MCGGDQVFIVYARRQLGALVFCPDFGKPEEQIFAASLDSTRALLASLSPTPIVAGYVDTMVPNAFAGRDAERHYIGMHQALLVTIVDLALCCFTQADFFPLIGDAASEASPAPSFGSLPGLFLLDRTLQGGVIEADTDRHRVPKDADRHVAAIYFALLMARFVWLHEWAHCHLGHVERLCADDAQATLVELVAPLIGFPAEPPAGPSTAERHAMELDADKMALHLCLGISEAGAENVPGIAALDEETRTEMIVVGAFLMTWLFEAYARHLNTATQATHPAPADRLTALIAAAPPLLSAQREDAAAVCQRAESIFRVLVQRMAATP